MGFFSEIKSALAEIFSSFSQPVVWRGRVMNAIISEGQEAVELESGGFVPDSTFNMKFLESELDGTYASTQLHKKRQREFVRCLFVYKLKKPITCDGGRLQSPKPTRRRLPRMWRVRELQCH